MSRASTPTLLSLDRYAKIMGLNPVHFNQAQGTTYWPDYGNCEDVWYQYSWQHQDDFASREDLALAIQDAEEEIAAVLGFPPAPKWIHGEVHQWEAPYGYKTRVVADQAYIIAGGQRAVDLIQSGATVTYSDPDTDGWNELATISVATTVTNEQQIKLYFAGKDGTPEWEIRPLKSVSISGGTATITVESYKLFDPDRWEAVPGQTGVTIINPESMGEYVSTVDVYHEYTDSTANHAVIYWEPTGGYNSLICPSCGGTGCARCTLISQDGCFSIKDAVHGIVTPWAATYDATNAKWIESAFTVDRQPDQVKVHYQAGWIDPEYLKGNTLDPLSTQMAQAIAFLATARIGRDMCACDSTRKYIHELQRDMTESSRNEFYVRYESQELFHNPFGTHVGEMRAWDMIRNLTIQGQFAGGGF